MCNDGGLLSFGVEQSVGDESLSIRELDTHPLVQRTRVLANVLEAY